MLTMHQRSVTVDRQRLLEALHANRDLHRAEYAEALVEYHARLRADLAAALGRVEAVTDVETLRNFRFQLPFPQNHETEYTRAIEMLEMSVSETIELDEQSFRAYFKNEWQWSGQMLAAKAAYATAGSSLSL